MSTAVGTSSFIHQAASATAMAPPRGAPQTVMPPSLSASIRPQSLENTSRLSITNRNRATAMPPPTPQSANVVT